MILEILNHTYQYEAEKLLRVFFPNEKIHVVFEKTENPEEEKAALPRSEKPSEKKKQSSIDKKLDDFARRINSNGFSASYPMMLGLTT